MARAKFTDKQRLFIAEYLVDQNGTQAAIRAGYSKKTANEIATQNLAKLHIREEIEKRLEKVVAKAELTAEMILAELMKLGFSNMADYYVIDEHGYAYVKTTGLTRDQMAAVQEIIIDDKFIGTGKDQIRQQRVRFKLADKRASLVNLGQTLDMFKHKVKIDLDDPIAALMARAAEKPDIPPGAVLEQKS